MPTFNIDDLNLADDLDVSVDQNDYVDPQMPMPLTAGRYGFRVTKWDLARDRKGAPDMNGQLPLQLQDGKYPIIELQAIEVVYPSENQRMVGNLYHSVRTKPFLRDDRKNGTSTQVNSLGDLLRSGDSSVSFSGIKEGLATLTSLIAQGTVFHARFDWTASDRDAIKVNLDEIRATALQNGTPLTDARVKTAEKQVYKTYTRRGMAKFKNEQGVTVPFMPSSVEGGDDIQARAEIVLDGFIPASQVASGVVKFGPAVR